jgi:hypothetical protein
VAQRAFGSVRGIGVNDLPSLKTLTPPRRAVVSREVTDRRGIPSSAMLVDEAALRRTLRANQPRDDLGGLPEVMEGAVETRMIDINE